MGFDADSDSVIGTFKIDLSQGQSQTLKCFDTYDVINYKHLLNGIGLLTTFYEQTAATHRSSTGKTLVTIEWTPPMDFDGIVLFK